MKLTDMFDVEVDYAAMIQAVTTVDASGVLTAIDRVDHIRHKFTLLVEHLSGTVAEAQEYSDKERAIIKTAMFVCIAVLDKMTEVRYPGHWVVAPLEALQCCRVCQTKLALSDPSIALEMIKLLLEKKVLDGPKA